LPSDSSDTHSWGKKMEKLFEACLKNALNNTVSKASVISLA